MSEIYKIVYCSRNSIGASPDVQDEQLKSILDASRNNNSRDQITGALLFNSNSFAQVLEGPQKAIERTFEMIQRDQRHSQVTVLENGKADSRMFPEWAMAHVLPQSEKQAEGIAAVLDFAFLNPSHSGREVLDLMKTLVVSED